MEAPSGLSPVQALIFHAFLSRSHNGFIREKHLRELLKSEVPEWLFPYILKLSDEYVVPILELIYAYWKNRNCEKIKGFCRLNRSSFVRSYDRMASYWDAGYGPFHQYVGRKLFLECYGYQQSLWHGQEPQKQRKYCGTESLNED